MDLELKIYLDERFGNIETRLEQTGKMLELKFREIDERFAQIDERLAQIDGRLALIDERFAQIDQRFLQIDQRFLQIDQRFEALDGQMEDKFTHWSQHILNEIANRLAEQRSQIESIDARLRAHAGMLQGGSKAMSRFIKFSEAAEIRWAESEKRWVDLLSRVENLERRLN